MPVTDTQPDATKARRPMAIDPFHASCSARTTLKGPSKDALHCPKRPSNPPGGIVQPGAGGLTGSISTPQELSGIAQRVFRGGPSLLRRLQHYRPFICPFEDLLSIVPPGSSVLDVGCGGGLWLALLRETGRLSRGVGFDSSKHRRLI